MSFCHRHSQILSILLVLFCVLPLALGDSSQDSPAASHDAPSLRSKSLVLTKIWCLIIVFFTTFLAGVSPYYCRWNQSFLVLGTQFAGGVFLSNALLHFLSDADATFKESSDVDYPFAFMLAACGYLLTMFGDCVIQWIFLKEVSADWEDVEKAGLKAHHHVEEAVADAEDRCDSCKQIVSQDKRHSDEKDTKTFVKATLLNTTSFGDTILLILALCFHSVFEGIAIGVAETTHDAWRALWTISLHKLFAAIAMGIALLKMLPNRPLLSCATYSFMFGVSSPIGVAIGIIINATTQGGVADWTFAITMGLACGVFIYVAINHLLAKGYAPQSKVQVDTPFFKFLAVVLGVGVISVVIIWD